MAAAAAAVTAAAAAAEAAVGAAAAVTAAAAAAEAAVGAAAVAAAAADPAACAAADPRRPLPTPWPLPVGRQPPFWRGSGRFRGACPMRPNASPCGPPCLWDLGLLIDSHSIFHYHVPMLIVEGVD